MKHKLRTLALTATLAAGTLTATGATPAQAHGAGEGWYCGHSIQYWGYWGGLNWDRDVYQGHASWGYGTVHIVKHQVRKRAWTGGPTYWSTEYTAYRHCH